MIISEMPALRQSFLQLKSRRFTDLFSYPASCRIVCGVLSCAWVREGTCNDETVDSAFQLIHTSGTDVIYDNRTCINCFFCHSGIESINRNKCFRKPGLYSWNRCNDSLQFFFSADSFTAGPVLVRRYQESKAPSSSILPGEGPASFLFAALAVNESGVTLMMPITTGFILLPAARLCNSAWTLVFVCFIFWSEG